MWLLLILRVAKQWLGCTNNMSSPRMKLYWANWALRIFLLRRQPESRSASAMKAASVNCLQTWKTEERRTMKNHTDRLNLTMLPGSGTLALLAYSSQEGLTGTNITWRGESHSGLVEEEAENQVFTLTPTLVSIFLTAKENGRQCLPAMMDSAGERMNVPPSQGATQELSHFVKCIQWVGSMFTFDQHLTTSLRSSPWGWRSSSPRSPGWLDGWWLVGLCRRHPSC